MTVAMVPLVSQVTFTSMPSAIGLTGALTPTAAVLDAIHGGNYRVTGTVKVTPATPAFRKVTLFDNVSRLLIREQWSDPVTGAYAFNNIRPGTFFVVSVDHTNTHNAVIADRLVAEPMP